MNCCEIGTCVREINNIPRGTHYELCRSVHSEMNAIIQASPEELKDATLYLVGIEYNSGDYVKDANCCAMCKRVIINAGIKNVIIRTESDHYKTINVKEWVDDDDSLNLIAGY